MPGKLDRSVYIILNLINGKYKRENSALSSLQTLIVLRDENNTKI